MWVRVRTADSASCFFLAMSVAELFLCSSSSLRSTETHKADINNHPLGLTVEAVYNVKKCERNPDSINNTHSQNVAFFFFFCSTQGRELPFSSCTWSFTIKPFFIHTKRDVKMFYYCGKVRCWLSVTLKWEVIRTGGVLTLLSALEYMGWWSVCGWPCRPAGVPRWRRRQHWAEADLLGGLETGMSDWHVPTCIETPAQIYIHIRQLWSEIRTDRRTRSYLGLASTWSWVWLPEGPRRWQWLTGHCVGWSSSLLHIPPQYQTSLSWKKWTQTLRVRQQQTQPGD